MKRILLPIALLMAIMFSASPALAHYPLHHYTGNMHHYTGNMHHYTGNMHHYHRFGNGGWGMPYYGGYGAFPRSYGYPGLGPMIGGYNNGLNFGIGGGF